MARKLPMQLRLPSRNWVNLRNLRVTVPRIPYRDPRNAPELISFLADCVEYVIYFWVQITSLVWHLSLSYIIENLFLYYGTVQKNYFLIGN
jgi:hypothetical protein